MPDNTDSSNAVSPIVSGLAGDAAKINPYGADPEQLQTFQQAQQDAVSALQHRYDQPNWFQIAAGFAKPQLGGFLASLGSASNAYGQQVENQRNAAASVAQMKAQLAQSNILLGQKIQAAALAKGPQTESTTSEITNLDSVRGEQLIKAQQARQAEITNNLQITAQNARARGLPMPPVNDMGLPMQSNSASPSDAPSAPGDAASISSSPSAVPSAPGNAASISSPSVVPSYKDTWGDASVADTRAQIEKLPEGPDKTAALNQLNKQVTDGKPNQKQVIPSTYEISPTMPYESIVSANKDTIDSLNAEGKAYRNSLGDAANNINHANAMRPINNLERYSQDPRFDSVMGILSGAGAISGIAEFVQHGIEGDVAGQHISLAVPLDKIALARKDPSVVSFAQDVYRNLASMALNNQRAAGVNASTARNAELSTLSSAASNPDTLAPAARYYIRESNLVQRMKHDMFNDNTKLITDKHDLYSLSKNSPTRLYEAENSPSQAQIVSNYEDAIAKEREKFLKQSSGVK